MGRLKHLFESVTTYDLIEITILAVIIYGILRFIGALRGAGTVRLLSIVAASLFLLVQVALVNFDMTELSQTLDYFMITAFVCLVVILQPEFRRGLFALGQRHRLWAPDFRRGPIAPRLVAALEHLSQTCTGALIAVQRDVSLASFAQTGEALDAVVSSNLLRAIFHKSSPLHDGAVIICDGRIAAAGCQFPLAEAPKGASRLGMRHRAAIGLSEETDADVLVVSEETGRVSHVRGGRMTVVPLKDLLEHLSRALDQAEQPAAAEAEELSLRSV